MPRLRSQPWRLWWKYPPDGSRPAGSPAAATHLGLLCQGTCDLKCYFSLALLLLLCSRSHRTCPVQMKPFTLDGGARPILSLPRVSVCACAQHPPRFPRHLSKWVETAYICLIVHKENAFHYRASSCHKGGRKLTPLSYRCRFCLKRCQQEAPGFIKSGRVSH